MRVTTILRQQIVRLTFFTRPNCPLCDDAMEIVDKVAQRRPFEFQKINVLDKGQRKWKQLYQFETPVLHIDAAEKDKHDFETTTDARKLMHRISEAQLEEAMDEALKSSS